MWREAAGVAVVLINIGQQLKGLGSSWGGRPRSHCNCEHERGPGKCLSVWKPHGAGGLGVGVEESLVTFGRVNPRETRRGALFQFLRTFENKNKIRLLTTPRYIQEEISEFATTYPFTNDYPFDFAQSLLLLHKREVGSEKCCLTRSAMHSWYQGLFSCVWFREGERSWWEVTTSMGFFLLSFAAPAFPDFE